MDTHLTPALNYLTAENGARIMFVSSSQKGCGPENVLNDNDRQLWLSDIGLPQELIIDISALKSRPAELRGFGWYCWHGYSSNPSIVELFVSLDGRDYIPWGTFSAQLKAGGSIYSIDPITRDYKYLKIAITETFGASRTYINQLYLLSDPPRATISNPVSNLTSPRAKLDTETQDSFKPAILTNPSVRFTDEVDSKDLKKKLSEQLQDLQENVSMMQVDRLVPAMPPPPLPVFSSITPKRPKSSLSAVSNKTDDIKNIKEEVKEWSAAINDMRENITILMKQVGALEHSMSIPNHLNTRESDFSLKAKQGSTLSYPSLQIPSNSIEDVFSALFDKKMKEWQESYLKPQLNSMMSRIEDKLDMVISRSNPKKVEDLVSKLQSKIYERTKKIESLEKERYSRMSNRSSSPDWRHKLNTSSLY